MAREYPLDRYRNFGIIAHIDAGKTTCSERILFTRANPTTSAKCTMALQPWTGWNKSRSAVLLSLLLRQRRSGNAQKTASTPDSPKHRMNIIDTPGHVDFTIEVERSLAVLDGAVVFLMPTLVLNHRPKPFGVRLTATKFRVSFLSTKWTKSALTSSTV